MPENAEEKKHQPRGGRDSALQLSNAIREHERKWRLAAQGTLGLRNDTVLLRALPLAGPSPMLGAMRKRYDWRRVAASWLPPLLMVCANPSSAQTLPVPPPLEQLQAECTRPQYASDTLVCGDAELRAADAQVAALASTPPPLAADAIWEDQAGWLRRRSLCAFKTDHRACLVAAYADRRAVLTASARAATQPIRCNGVLNGRTLASSTLIAGQALTIAENGQVVAVAMPPGATWQPWLVWRATGNRIKLQPQGAAPVTCRLYPTPP